jgi:peptidoglycan/LPS O-acetylase OafA/YrhL
VADITHSQFSLAQAAHMPNSFLDLLFDALLNVYAHLSGKVEYVGDVLWTMRYEMVGSLLIMVLYSLFKPFLSKVHLKWLLLALLCVLAVNNMYYALFVAGALFFEFGDTKLSLPAKLSIPMCLLALYLGSVPFYMTDYWVDGNRWHVLGLDPDMTTAQLLHSLGSVLLVGVVLFSDVLNRSLEAFIPQFLGRVSFMLYLSHYIVICSVGSWIFLALYQFNGPYIESVLPAVIATVGVSLALAWGLTRYVDEPGVTLSKKVGFLLNTVGLTKRTKEA